MITIIMSCVWTECIFIFAHSADTTGMTHPQIYLNFIFVIFRAKSPPPPSGVVWRVSIFAKTAYYPRHVRPTCPSVRVYERGSSGRISIKFDIGRLLWKPVEKLIFFFFFPNSDRNIGNFTDEDLMTFHCCWRRKLALKHSHAIIPCVFIPLAETGITEQFLSASRTMVGLPLLSLSAQVILLWKSRWPYYPRLGHHDLE